MAKIKIGNIKGPQGPIGPTGPQGPRGETGPQGPLPPLTNNGLATVAGVSALDAAYGKTLTEKDAELQKQIDTTNSNLDAVEAAIPKNLQGKQVLYGTTEITTDSNGAGWIPFNPNFKDSNILFLQGVMDINIADRCVTTPAYNGMAVELFKSGNRVSNKSVWLTWIAIGIPL